MKRLVRSEAYARARLVSGTLFGILGAVVAYRTLTTAGFAVAALPGSVLGIAMLALAVVRFREYAAARRT